MDYSPESRPCTWEVKGTVCRVRGAHLGSATWEVSRNKWRYCSSAKSLADSKVSRGSESSAIANAGVLPVGEEGLLPWTNLEKALRWLHREQIVSFFNLAIKFTEILSWASSSISLASVQPQECFISSVFNFWKWTLQRMNALAKNYSSNYRNCYGRDGGAEKW